MLNSNPIKRKPFVFRVAPPKTCKATGPCEGRVRVQWLKYGALIQWQMAMAKFFRSLIV